MRWAHVKAHAFFFFPSFREIEGDVQRPLVAAARMTLPERWPVKSGSNCQIAKSVQFVKSAGSRKECSDHNEQTESSGDKAIGPWRRYQTTQREVSIYLFLSIY